MKAIGVRELKARLSQYLRDVRAGEVVLVTDRGQVVAELRAPGSGIGSGESRFEQGLRRLAAGGGLVIGERRHRPGAYPPSPLHAPDGTAQRLIDEDRGEA